MARPPRNPLIGMREGVSPSCVALPVGPWATLLDFLSERLSNVPRSEWAERMAQGLVLLEDGHAVLGDQAYRHGQRLYYYRHLPAEPALPFTPSTVFEDELLLVADKPHFMPVTPSGQYVQQSLLVQLKRLTGCEDLTPIHRIDRETAGLVVFSKRPQDRNAYQALFRDKAVHKIYHAVAAHQPNLALPRLHTSRMAEDPEQFFKMREVPGEANSETRIGLLHHQAQRALYQLEPITGKRHQLRVHMNALGMPIEGDQFYPRVLRGPDEAEDFSQPLQLLAQAIRLTDPVTGKQRVFESRLQLALPLSNCAA
jgi:tRNA pseudouridine32 synthase / 23S rRNA pseudouridine746 synthase